MHVNPNDTRILCVNANPTERKKKRKYRVLIKDTFAYPATEALFHSLFRKATAAAAPGGSLRLGERWRSQYSSP